MPQAGEILWPSLWLIAALLALALILALFQRWRQRAEEAEDSATDQLSQFRTLYEAGQISEQEYRRLHDLLAGRIQKEAGIRPKGTEKPEAASAEFEVIDEDTAQPAQDKKPEPPTPPPTKSETPN